MSDDNETSLKISADILYRSSEHSLSVLIAKTEFLFIKANTNHNIALIASKAVQAPLKVYFYDELIFVYRIDHIKKASFSRELLTDIVKFVAILEMDFYLPVNADIKFTMNDGEIRFSASNTLILKQMCDQESLFLNSLTGLKTLLDLGDKSK